MFDCFEIQGLGTLHEDKPLDAKNIVAKTGIFLWDVPLLVLALLLLLPPQM